MPKRKSQKSKKLLKRKINLKNPLVIIFVLLSILLGVYFLTTQITNFNSEAADGEVNPKCDATCVSACDDVCTALSDVSHINKKGVSALNQCKNTCKNRVYVEVNLDGKSCNQVCSRMRHAVRRYWCNELCPKIKLSVSPTITLTLTPTP